MDCPQVADLCRRYEALVEKVAAVEGPIVKAQEEESQRLKEAREREEQVGRDSNN